MSLFPVLSHPPTLTDLDPQLQEPVLGGGRVGLSGETWGQGRRHTGISFVTTTTQSSVELFKGN